VSYLRDIEAAQRQMTLSQAEKRLSCHFRDPDKVDSGIDYINRRIDGRISGPKPALRSRVAERLIQLDREAEAERLAHLMEWNT